VSYGEGLTTDTSPGSCAGNGNIASEALTRESAPVAGCTIGLVFLVRDKSPSADVFQLYLLVA